MNKIFAKCDSTEFSWECVSQFQDSSLFSCVKETAHKHFNHHKGRIFRTKFQIFLFPACCTQAYLEIQVRELHSQKPCFSDHIPKVETQVVSLEPPDEWSSRDHIVYTIWDVHFFPFLLQTATSPPPILLHCYYVQKCSTVFPHMKKLARKDRVLLAEVYPGIMPINNHFLVATRIPLFQFGHSVHSSSAPSVLP